MKATISVLTLLFGCTAVSNVLAQGHFQWGNNIQNVVRAAENKTRVHDLHATLLHLLGLDHERLTFRHDGRDERLTDVAGTVIERALA